MRNFELDKDRLELILCAERFDNWNDICYCGGVGNVSAEKLFELAELGYLFEHVIEYVEKNPKCRCKDIAKSFPRYNGLGYYSSQKISAIIHKLIRAGVLKREIEEEAMLVPLYPWKKDSATCAIKAEIPFFSLA